MPQSSTVGKAVRSLDALDVSLFRRVARSHSPLLDTALPRLTRAADHSVLWISIAAVLEGFGTRRAGRAARRGITCLAITSFVANQLGKRALPRRRPSLDLVPLQRIARRVPTSSSFPSGHSASAAAFAVAVSMEMPELALPIGALAAAVCYSRVYTGVHYPGDVVAGAALGAGIALMSRRLAPSRTPAVIRTLPTMPDPQPGCERGAGVVAVVNPLSGGGRGAGVADLIAAELPDAKVLELPRDGDLLALLRKAAEHADIMAIAGGDGTVGCAAQVAMETGKPLLVIPGGTFNHFAADLGLSTAADAIRALRAGSAIKVDVATVAGTTFMNTASIGAYPDFVAARQRRENRLGKPLAALIAALSVLRDTEPLRLRIDGRERLVSMIFIGSGRYQPHGFAPQWRPRLDDGKFDLRYLEAGHRFPVIRLLASLAAGRLGRSRMYLEDDPVDLQIERLDGPGTFAFDGEIGEGPAQLLFEKHRRAVTVYCGPAERS